MKRKNLLFMLPLICVGGLAIPVTNGMNLDQQGAPPMAIYAPDRLLRDAERSGLWSKSIYPLSFDINPFYLRGDFNGDGENDLAFWVTEASSGKRGIVLIHSTLDTLWVFGAGIPFEGFNTDEIWVDTWNVLPKGTRLRPWSSNPAIGMKEGEYFVFQQEAISPKWIAKSSFAIYWHNDRYHYIKVSD